MLRGPQGTLFGKNSAGGAIRYITRKPSFDEAGGYAKATLGSFERRDARAALNLPLSGNAALRLAAASLKQDGYIKRLADDGRLGAEDTLFARARPWPPSHSRGATRPPPGNAFPRRRSAAATSSMP